MKGCSNIRRNVPEVGIQAKHGNEDGPRHRPRSDFCGRRLTGPGGQGERRPQPGKGDVDQVHIGTVVKVLQLVATDTKTVEVDTADSRQGVPRCLRATAGQGQRSPPANEAGVARRAGRHVRLRQRCHDPTEAARSPFSTAPIYAGYTAARGGPWGPPLAPPIGHSATLPTQLARVARAARRRRHGGIGPVSLQPPRNPLLGGLGTAAARLRSAWSI